MTCPGTRICPQMRGIGVPSPAVCNRSRSTRPVSTGFAPAPISRWSMTRPMVAPTARPITAPVSPSMVPPKPAPTEAPAAARSIVAIAFLLELVPSCGPALPPGERRQPASGQRNRAAIRAAQGPESGLSTTPCRS